MGRCVLRQGWASPAARSADGGRTKCIGSRAYAFAAAGWQLVAVAVLMACASPRPLANAATFNTGRLPRWDSLLSRLALVPLSTMAPCRCRSAGAAVGRPGGALTSDGGAVSGFSPEYVLILCACELY
jgi:hypothetical protein